MSRLESDQDRDDKGGRPTAHLLLNQVQVVLHGGPCPFLVENGHRYPRPTATPLPRQVGGLEGAASQRLRELI